MSGLCTMIGPLILPCLILLALNVIDYKTALAAAPYREKSDKRVVSSEKSINGIIKKVNMYWLIFIGFSVDCLLKYTLPQFIAISVPAIFAIVITCWLIYNEIISILENLEDAKVDIPPFLLPLMKKMRGEVNDRISMDSKEE